MNDFQPNQDICLVPYYPAYEIALPWYQDAELCHHVDNQNRIYDLSILKNNKAKAVRFTTLDALCRELGCQPGDILEYVPDDAGKRS